jgi:hypothetical protein
MPQTSGETSATSTIILETQIGQTIVSKNLNEVLDKLDSFTAEIKHSIKDVKLLTNNFHSNYDQRLLSQYTGGSYNNIATRIDNTSSLETDLFMAAIWEQRHQDALQNNLNKAGIKLSDIEKYLDIKLRLCIEKQSLQGRDDYMKAFLEDKAGARAVNELLLEQHGTDKCLFGHASRDYYISKRGEFLEREVHQSFNQAKDIIELLLNHDNILQKNKQTLLKTLCATFTEEALNGCLLYDLDDWSCKEDLQKERRFRDHMISKVQNNSLEVDGFSVDFPKVLNSKDFLSHYIYLKEEDGQLKFPKPREMEAYSFSLAILKSQEKHLNPDVQEAVKSLITSEDFLNSPAAIFYLRATLQLGNDKLINEFIGNLELKHLENKGPVAYHIVWSLLEANLTPENTEKILSFAGSDQLINNHGYYANGTTVAESLFEYISIDCVDSEIHKTKGIQYAKRFFEALDPEKISGADIASTVPYHNKNNKDSQVKSSLEGLIPNLKKCSLDPEIIEGFILKVLEKDYTEVLKHGTLNQIFALNQSIQSLDMSDHFPDFKKNMEAYITDFKPELKISLKDIQSTNTGQIISGNWNFSFLDKVINCFDQESPAVTLLETQRKHAELMKYSLEQIDTKGLKINQAEGLQDIHKNNEALQVLGEAFIQADIFVHKYLPAIYLMEGIDSKFTQKIEDLYDKSNVVRQAGFIAKLHKLSSNDEKHNIKIENLETKLIQDCKNSDHLDLMLISLNQEDDFSYSPKFIKTLYERIKQTDFIWNISEDQQRNFKEELITYFIPDAITTKLDLVIKAHELNNKELVQLEASLINECRNAHDLNAVILTLNESNNFKYSAAFRESLLAKIYKDENFTWNTKSSEVEKFKKSLPPLFNTLLMDTLPTIEGLKIKNLNTCPTALELHLEDDGATTLHMLKNGKQVKVATIVKNENKESYTIKNKEAQDEIKVSVLGKIGKIGKNGDQGCDYFVPGDYLKIENQLFYCNQNKETAQLEFIEVTAANISLLRSLTKNENNHLSLSEALAYYQRELILDNNKIISSKGFNNESLLNHSRFQKLQVEVYFEDLKTAIANKDLKTVVNLTSLLIDSEELNLPIDKLSSLVNGFMESRTENPLRYEVSYAEIQAKTREGRMYPNEDIKFLDEPLKILKKHPQFDSLSIPLTEGLENLKEVYQAIQSFHSNDSTKIININSKSRNNALELFGDFLFHMDDANTNYVLPLLELPNLKPEFQERLDKRFTAALLPTKAAYVARMQKINSLAATSENASTQYLKRETEMLQSCTSSEMLIDLLTELKDHKFYMDKRFISSLLNRVKQDDFKWNMCDTDQEYFIDQLTANEIIEHPPALVSYLEASGENVEMIISQYINGEQRDIGTIKKNNEDGFTLKITKSASDLAFSVNGIAKGSEEDEISFQAKDFLRIDKKLYYVAKNNVYNQYELRKVSDKAALMGDLFFLNGDISVSQKSLPECMHLAGIIAALNDENGTLIKGLMQGLSPDIDSQGRTIYSFRFPTEVIYDAQIPGLNTQRIFLKRDDEHGLRESQGRLVPTEIDYEAEGDNGVKRYIKTHSAGAPGVAIISYAITELLRRTANLYSILGEGQDRVHIEPKMPVREVGKLLGMEPAGSQGTKSVRETEIQYQAGDPLTIDSSFSQDPSVNGTDFINTLTDYLKDPYYKMIAGSRPKTRAEALTESGKESYEDCTWAEKNVFKQEENGHRIVNMHAVVVSLAENGDFLIHCPHNSLMPVALSPKQFLNFYDQVNIFRINEMRTFMENPLP